MSNYWLYFVIIFYFHFCSVLGWASPVFRLWLNRSSPLAWSNRLIVVSGPLSTHTSRWEHQSHVCTKEHEVKPTSEKFGQFTPNPTLHVSKLWVNCWLNTIQWGSGSFLAREPPINLAKLENLGQASGAINTLFHYWVRYSFLL